MKKLILTTILALSWTPVSAQIVTPPLTAPIWAELQTCRLAANCPIGPQAQAAKSSSANLGKAALIIGAAALVVYMISKNEPKPVELAIDQLPSMPICPQGTQLRETWTRELGTISQCL